MGVHVGKLWVQIVILYLQALKTFSQLTTEQL